MTLRPPRPAAPTGRLRAHTLAAYGFRQLPGPTALTVFCVALALVVSELPGLMELWLSRGADTATVARIALFDLLIACSRVLPLAVLLGAVLAAGGLRARGELLGAESAGIAARELAVPFALFGALVAGLALGLAHFATPWSQRGIHQALEAVVRAHPLPPLAPGVPERLGTWRIEAQQVENAGRDLRGVALWLPGSRQTLFARSAVMAPTPPGVEIRLADGVVLQRLGDTLSSVRFRRLERALPLPEPVAMQWSDAMPSSDLWLALRGEASVAVRREAAAEWHRRFALPLAALPLAVLALPVAARFGRSSRTGNLLLGLGVGLVHYTLVLAGNAALQNRSLPVALAIWLPDLVLLAGALLLLRAMDRGQAPRTRAWLAARSRSTPRPPSGTRVRRQALARHVGRTFLVTSLLCVAGLLVAFVVADTLDNLTWFARYDATPREAFRYEALRVPVLASRLLPYALLASAAIALGMLERRGELVGMRASGISPLRIAAPILLVCALAVPLDHMLSNEIAPRALSQATRLKRTEIKERPAASAFESASGSTALWQRSGSRFYVADVFDPRAGLARGVRIYELDAAGMPRALTDASEGRHLGGGVWRLVEPMRFELDAGAFAHAPAEIFVRLGDDVPAGVEAAHLTLGALRREIRAEWHAGAALPLRVDWHARVAAPLACLLLPALALLGSVNRVPYPLPARSVLGSAAAGVAYALIRAAAGALGAAGNLSPAVAGWGPPALLAVVVVVLALRQLRPWPRSPAT